MRLRVGVVLWLASWIPYGIILGLDGLALTLSWTFEVLLGITGLALAGHQFALAVKTCGWRHAPKVAWSALRHGRDIEHDVDADVEPDAVTPGGAAAAAPH